MDDRSPVRVDLYVVISVGVGPGEYPVEAAREDLVAGLEWAARRMAEPGYLGGEYAVEGGDTDVDLHVVGPPGHEHDTLLGPSGDS